LSEHLCRNCIHKDVCVVAELAKTYGLNISRCNRNRLSFDKAQLKAAEEEYTKNE